MDWLVDAVVGPASYLAYAMDRGIDFFLRIKRTDGEAHAAVAFHQSELAVDQRRAMQTGSNCDVVIRVEQYAHIARVDPCHVHQDG